VKSESEVEMIRATLAANGVGKSDRSKSEEAAAEKQRLLQQIREEEERLARHEAEARQLGKELSAVSSALTQERMACRDARSRSLINEATERVLDASLQVYEEYSRRLVQETERLSFFATEDDEALALDSELVARSQLLQKLVAAARADEKMVRETLIDSNLQSPDSSVELMVYNLQREHVLQFAATQELKAATAPASGNSDAKQEAAELRAALKVLQSERDKLLQGQGDNLLLAHDLKDRVQELANLQRELKVVQENIENSIAQGGVARSALLELGSEVRALIQEHVLSLENAFDPIAEELRDSVQRELEHFDRTPMSQLLRSTVSPQAAGLQPPLVQELRIYTSKYVLTSIAALLEFSPAHSFDHFLEHIQALGQEVRENAASLACSSSSVIEAADDRVGAAFAKEAETIRTAVLPVFQRVERATLQVESLKEAVEKAFLEWKTLPAQFCIPQEEQRERFMRRYNYLRVLAHDAAKRNQK
jgi:hypothetical protein